MGHWRDMAVFISEFFAGDPAIERKKKHLDDLEIPYTINNKQNPTDVHDTQVEIKWLAPKPKNTKDK